MKTLWKRIAKSKSNRIKKLIKQKCDKLYVKCEKVMIICLTAR